MRIAISSVLFAALIADAVVMRRLMHNENQFYAGGPLGVVLASALALALSTPRIRGHVLAASIVLFGGLGAVAVGGMFATCDQAMRPFILQLVGALMTVALVGSGLIFASVPAMLGAGWASARLFRASPNGLTYAGLLVASALVAVATYFIASALGARPVVGNCVL